MGRVRDLIGRARRSEEAAPVGGSGDPRRRTFLDAGLEADLDRDGYVVVDLLDEASLRDLRSQYDVMDHAQGRDSPFAEGFHTTMYDDRVEYRRVVLDTVDKIIGPALDRLLDRHRIVVANFAVKLPQGAAVPFHRDWTWVDEERSRSVGVWCALVDTDLRNGALGMVAGSHLELGGYRPVNDRVYVPYEPDAAVQGERLLPLRAGQAIVYDSRTVHFSAPNTTSRSRLAAACIATPDEAELVHHWLDADGHTVEFVVSREFYLTYVVGRDPSAAEGVAGVRLVRGAGASVHGAGR